MVANLYLHPDAFVYNGVDSRQAVKDKFVALVQDMKEVVYCHSKENIFILINGFVDTEIFEQESVIDFACAELGPDESGIFFPMLANTAEDLNEISLGELQDLCNYSDKEIEVNSVLILNRLSQSTQDADDDSSIRKDYILFDNYEVVYDKCSWFHLRRQILGNHPGDPQYFIQECRKYFPSLFFHDNCIDSLVDGEWKYLEMVPRRIVYYLSCLNDKFEEVRGKTISTNPNEILKNFSGTYGLDRSGSLQQNHEKKSFMTFDFKSEKDGKIYPVLCEPHLKIDQVDSNRNVGNINTQHFNPRIYFCYTSPEIANGKLLVGSIGKHV